MKNLRRVLIFTSLFICLIFGNNIQAEATNYSFTRNELSVTGEDEDSIVFLILGDGFTEEEQNVFNQKAKEIMDYIVETDPFDDYRPYMNFYSINVVSNESGAGDNPNDLKDTYFQSSFNSYGIERLLTPNNTEAYDLAEQYVPYYDTAIMIVNDTRYGGSGGSISVTSINSSSYEILVHELGHTIGGLNDEYWAGDDYAHEGFNMSQESNSDLVPWSDYIGVNGIGVYPYKENPSWYRPHEKCKMQYLGWDIPFCDVCKDVLSQQLKNQQWQSYSGKVQYDLLSEIKVTPSSKTLYVGGTTGKTKQIKITVPSNLNKVDQITLESLKRDTIDVAITYEMDDPSIATVSKTGKVTGKRVGTTTLYVMAELEDETEEYLAEIIIQVKKASIKITTSKKSIEVGDQITWKAKIYGFKQSDITWSSNNKNLVINKTSGKATGKKVGTSQITLKAGKLKKVVNVKVVK